MPVRIGGVGGPQPRNTLERPSALSSADPAARPAKRQKLSHDVDSREHKTLSASPSASRSSLGVLSPEHAFPPRIQEFRNLEKSTGTIRRRIRRPRADTLPGRSPETLQSGGNQTQGQLSSDPINLDSPERPRAEEQRSQTQTVGSPAADEVSLVKVQWTHDRPLKYGRRRESGNAQSPKTYRTDLFRPKENMDGDSIDELQEDQVLPRSHRQTISSKRNVPRRGSTLDESALASAKATIGSGLRVAEATTYANGYSEAEDGTERYLQLGDRHDCLVPVNHKGVPVEELEWMKISLDSCARIFRAKSDCSVIEILRRTSGDVRPEDKTLMVSFSSVDSVRRFDEWASRESKNMDLKDKDKLVATMKKMAEDRKDKAKRPLREQESGSNGLNGRRQSPVPKISTPASAVHRNSTPSQVPIRRETIRDRMLSTRVADASKAIQARSGGEIESKQSLVSPLDRTRRMTRNMQRPALDLDEVPQLSKGWTVQHPDWATKYQWNGSLLWQRERVDEEDISRLDEGGFLNDNLVMFYLRWLYAELQDRDAKTAGRIYLHNSHFYERLKPSRPGTRQINYDAVKSWTAKVDIFSFDYIVVPVCENIHWYLAIICNPSKLLPVAEADSLEVVESHPSSRVASPGQVTEPLRKLSLEAVQKAGEGNRHGDAREEPVDVDSQAARVSGSQSSSRVGNESAKRRRSGLPIRQYDPNMPRIVTLDSMDQAHSQTCVHLRDYLVAEIHARKHIEIENPGPLGMTAKGIPYQPNSWDCGIYLLGYMDAFFKNPDGFIAGILQREAVPMDIQPSALRAKIRSTIFDKMAEQRSSKKDQGPAKSHNVPLSVERASPLAEKLGRQQEPTTAKKVVDARNERPVREERTVRVIQQKPEAEGKENEQKQSTAVLPHGENSDLQPLKSPSKRPRSVQNRLSGSGHNAELEELCQESARMRKRLRSRETAADRRSSVTTQVVDLDEDEVANTTATSAAPADSARIVHIDDEKGDGKRSHNDDETTSRGAPWRGRPAGHPRTRPGPLVRQAELQHVDLSD